MTAVAARLKLRNWLQLRRFFVVNRAVERQLETTSGLISYSRYDRIRARCDRACLAHQDGDGAPSEGLHFVDHEMGHRAELHRGTTRPATPWRQRRQLVFRHVPCQPAHRRHLHVRWISVVQRFP